MTGPSLVDCLCFWVVGSTGLTILPNGISQLTDETGRQSGEAFVQFALGTHADEALLKHKQQMGHRWGRVDVSRPRPFREGHARD